MLSRSLEKLLNDLFQQARSERADFVTVERLLRALLSDSKCRDVLAASGAEVEKVEHALDDYIAQIPSVAAGSRNDVQPTLGFQRTLQRAVFHIQASGRKTVGCLDVLVSLFSARESMAVRILAEQGIEREHLLRQLGETGWDDAPVDVSTTSGLVEHTVSAGASVVRSQSSIEKRLDALEAKLDEAISEIRDLSAKLMKLIEGLPTKE
jgi:ATP-dependent Clp protease ATP-binding subunit ClpA